MKTIEDSTTISGPIAMQWAKEISKLPDGHFTVAFFPCSRNRGMASDKLPNDGYKLHKINWL